jgi:putative SOS response-associated peptidase YedK
MAAIWEDLHDEGQPAFLMLTVAANPLLARAEDRMPAVLDQSDWPMWLGEVDAPFREIKALLRTFEDQGNWEMLEQDKLKSAKPPAPKPPPQLDLF